jgi:hypothetical protein
MPLGLSSEDFEGLDPTPRASAVVSWQPVREDVYMPNQTNQTKDAIDACEWSAADDRVLVSTVLDKLNLSRGEWNDCVRKIGKDRDSLGKRWKVLVGDGDVGLRRGSGSRNRPELRRAWTEDRHR